MASTGVPALVLSGSGADAETVLVAARYAQATVQRGASKGADGMLTLQTPQGEITGLNAILRYVGRLHPASNLDGAATDFQTSQVDQWMEFAANEMSYLTGGTGTATALTSKVLSVLDDHLAKRTFLVGQRITLADIVVAAKLSGADLSPQSQ
eukprot:12642-Heterococcus_DN1.PRE.3